MDKKLKNIIIIFCTVLVLVIANILLRVTLQKESDSSQSSQIIYISNYSIGSVQKIEIENQYGSLTLVLENDTWYASGHEEESLDQEVMSELTYMLAHITGECVASESEDTTNAFGMLTPAAKITTYHDGALEQTFIIGDKAPAADEYYMQSSIFKKVFTVDMVYYTYGQLTLDDLLELNQVNIEHADIEKIKIRNSFNEEFTIQKTADDNDISLCYWEFAEPFNHDVDTAVMYGTEEYSGVITYLTQLSAESVVGSMGEETIFGLDAPIFSAEIFGYDGQYQSFVIGDYGNDEYYSLMFNDDKNIYSVLKESVPFIDYSAFMIAEPNLNLINIESVNSVIVDLPDLKTQLDISKATVNNTDGTVSYNIDISVDNLDDSIASDIAAQKILFYEDIVTIKIDNLIIEDMPAEEKIGSIVFELSSSIRDRYAVDFYEYSQTHYIAQKNGEGASYLVSKKNVEKLAEQYKLLMNGKLK